MPIELKTKKESIQNKRLDFEAGLADEVKRGGVPTGIMMREWQDGHSTSSPAPS